LSQPIAFDDFVARLNAASGGEALELLRRDARELATEHGERYRRFVLSLPEELWGRDPLVVSSLGLSYRAAGTAYGDAAFGYFRGAHAALAVQERPAPMETASVLLDEAGALRARGRLDDAAALVARARSIVETDASSPVQERVLLGARCGLAVGVEAVHAGAMERASEGASLARGMAEADLVRAERIETLGILALRAWTASSFDAALEHVAAVRGLAAGTTLLASGYAALALATEALVRAERDEFDEAAAVLPELRRAAADSEWEPFADVVEGRYHDLRGAYLEALDVLQHTEQLYATWLPAGVGRLLALGLRATALISLDQTEEAEAVLAELPELHTEFFCSARLLAQLRLLHGDLDGADATLRACETHAERHAAGALIEVQVLRAAIELERANFRVSDVAFDRALLRMARAGLRAPLRHAPRGALAMLLTRAAARSQPAGVPAFIEGLRVAHGLPLQAADPLSEQELRVVEQAGRGLTVGGIAQALFISPNTVKTHLRRVYRKLGVNSREEAVLRARAFGLLEEVTPKSPAPRVRRGAGS